MSAAAFAAVAAFFMVVFCKHQKPRVFIHVIISRLKTWTLLKGAIKFVILHRK